MTALTKETTVGTNNLQPGELIHMDFDLYNITSIGGFTSMLSVVCAKTRTLFAFPTAYKLPPVRIICFILTKFNTEQHPYNGVRVDEYGALANSTDITNLLVDDFKISMENTGGDSS